MSVLVMRLSGPWQAWGVDSRYARRDTMPRPSKSGVVGLLANALGRPRDADLADLAGLRFGCRVERAGRVERDFHTARAEGAKNPFVSTRYHLADACFLAAVEGDDVLLAQLGDALRQPRRPLFLGRRSCVPDAPVLVGTVAGGLEQVLREHPPVTERFDPGTREWFRDADEGEPAVLVPDHPTSFRAERRIHALRPVTSGAVQASEATANVDHFDAVKEG